MVSWFVFAFALSACGPEQRQDEPPQPSSFSRAASSSVQAGPESCRLELGDPQSETQLYRGFSRPESGPVRKFVWSEGASSALSLPLGRVAPTVYSLKLLVRAYSPIAPLKVELSLNGVSLGSHQVNREWGEVVAAVPEGTLKPGENFLEMNYSRHASPSALQAAHKDDRSLAVALGAVLLTPGPDGDTP